jgi:hypothetical protein
MENVIDSGEQTTTTYGITSQEAQALYYSGRLYYDPQDTRMAVGRYTPEGGVILFKNPGAISGSDSGSGSI